RCRQAFRNLKMLHRIVPDIQALLNLDPDAPLPEPIDPDDDFAHPTAWWEPPPETTLSLGDGAYGERPGFRGNDEGEVDDPLADWTPDGPSN
ncbi:MAG: hypothetical protein AAGN64_12375, partial [Bacteroidota bacterium]